MSDDREVIKIPRTSGIMMGPQMRQRGKHPELDKNICG